MRDHPFHSGDEVVFAALGGVADFGGVDAAGDKGGMGDVADREDALDLEGVDQLKEDGAAEVDFEALGRAVGGGRSGL